MSVSLDDFCDKIQAKIETEYARRGDTLGWRFLSCPRQNIDKASVAFVGLNPGGRVIDAENDGFSVETGSAYSVESWGGARAGKSPLQIQVLSLFELINVSPENVLSGNIVPFRSGSLAELNDRKAAFDFGETIWRSLLLRSKVKLVVAMGGEATRVSTQLLNIKDIEKVSSGWGKVTIQKGRREDLAFVGLPHLSTFKLLSNDKCIGALKSVFDEIPNMPAEIEGC